MKYRVMGNPCSITTDDKLWCISGSHPVYGAGVLAWCYDEEHARFWYEIMVVDPEFTGLYCHKFIEG
jgi:hypothetical protein